MGSGTKFHQTTRGLTAVNDATPIYGPGRLHAVDKLLATVHWPSNSTQGVIVLEVADSPEYPDTWRTINTFSWAVAGTIDNFTFQAPFFAMRLRVTTAVDGAITPPNGAVATAGANVTVAGIKN